MQRIDRQFRALTKACFARYGHGYDGLLGNWTAIAGDELASIARPERLRWPRAQAEGAKGGATLVLRVMEGHALEVQHETARLVERINGFFGYQAVGAVKVLQGPLPDRGRGRPPLPEPSGAEREKVESRLKGLEYARLKDAVRRLGASVSVSNTRR